jgi:GWxTD domain-containing protein
MKRMPMVLCAAIAAWLAFGCPSSLSAGEIEPIAESDLRQLVYSHPDSALLHARLASLYFAKGTVEGRTRATDHLKRALRIDPSDNRFRLLLAEVYFEATFWDRGVKELRRILETEPHNGDARFRLGCAYLQRALEEWKKDWFERAIAELSLVEDDNPAFCKARRKLALCLFDMGRPDSAAALLGRFPEDSLDTDALLMMGMALNETKDPAGADRAFDRALAKMDGARRERYLSVGLLATSEELDRMADMPPGDRDSETDLAWRKRDPNPATRFNERLIEHLSRVAFADFHFSVPRLDRPGSETTRGEVFIRYGRPLAWFYDPFGNNVFTDETIMPLTGWSDLGPQARWEHVYGGDDFFRPQSVRYDRSRWVWRYRDFVLDFEDTFMNGDYTFPYERDWSAYTYAYLERVIPEIYESQIKKKMRVVIDALNRLDAGGNPFLKIVYACDTRGVDYQPDYEWPEGDFEVQLAVLDTSRADILRSTLAVSLAADSSAMYRTDYPMIASYEAKVPPGRAVAAVSLRSEANGAVGFTSEPIVVREFGKGLEVSDVEFRFNEKGPSNPSHVYLWRGYAHLAFDVYNLAVDRVGTGHAEVAYSITRRKEKVGVAKRLTDYLGFTSPDESLAGIASVESSYELRSLGPHRAESIGIDLAPLSRGTYDVEVTVKDLLSGETTSTTAEFTIASELRQ